MRRLALAWIALVLTLPALAHEGEPSRVEIRPDWNGPQRAGELTLSYQLWDKETKRFLGASDLEIVHEKLVHMFLFDPALEVYEHVHPDFVGGRWVVKVKLATNARYWVWAQAKFPGEQGDEFTTNTRLDVVGGTPSKAPVPPVLPEKRRGNDGRSIVAFSGEKLRAKRMAMLTLGFSRTDGTPAQVTPYLGALAHVAAVPSDGDALIHVHPMDHGGKLMIHAFFPAAGDYRAWVQFIDAGELRTVALNLHVNP